MSKEDRIHDGKDWLLAERVAPRSDLDLRVTVVIHGRVLEGKICGALSFLQPALETVKLPAGLPDPTFAELTAWYGQRAGALDFLHLYDVVDVTGGGRHEFDGELVFRFRLDHVSGFVLHHK